MGRTRANTVVRKLFTEISGGLAGLISLAWS